MEQIPGIVYGKAEYVIPTFPPIPPYEDNISFSLRNKDVVRTFSRTYSVSDPNLHENREKYTIYISDSHGYVIFDSQNKPLLSHADNEITIDYVSQIKVKSDNDSYFITFHFLNSNVCLRFFIKDIKWKDFPEKLLEEKLAHCVIAAQNELIIS